MKIRRIIRSLLAAGAAMALALGCAAAEEVSVTDAGLGLGDNRVGVPVVSGMADEALQQEINRRLQDDLGIDGYLTRMALQISEESVGIRTDWEGGVRGDVLSLRMAAEGALENTRSTYAWTSANIDLRDGHEIGLDELFTDGEAARAAIEEYLEWEVAPELSAHLESSELLPLPEKFYLDEAGLTLLYPVQQLSTLSDRAGDIRIGWNELAEWLDTDEDGIPARIGALRAITLTQESAERIRAMAESGRLPGVPVTVGEKLKPLTDRYHLLIDPDVYEGGRMFSLEGGCFRDVFLLTDFLSEKWDDSVVQGIRMDRGCAEGLCVGKTIWEEWRAVLGEPDHTAELDADKAEGMRREMGGCDYYRFGDCQLQLYCGEDGVLVSITLTE